MAKKSLPTSGLKARRRRRRLQIALLVLAGVALLIAGFAALLNLPFWRITNITVTGTESIAPGSIETIARENLQGSYFYSIPKDNVLFYPKRAIRRAILAEHQAVAEVSFSRENLQSLGISINEYSPHALWCGESPASSSPCILLDERGKAYAQAVSLGGSSYIRYYGPLSSDAHPRQYLSEEKFRSLSALLAEFEKRLEGENIIRVSVDEFGDARAGFASGFVIVFSTEDSGAAVLQRFGLALQAEPFEENPLSAFEYLDLRFGDKLYYKLIGENAVE